MAKVENIVFDMGGVLMTFDGLAFSRSFTESEDDAQLLFRALYSRTEWALLDSGTIGHETLRRIAKASLPERLWPALDACIAGWPALSQVIEPVNDMGLRLHAEGYHLYVLSNASDRIDEQLGRAPVYPVLEGKVVSACERIMKPEPAIYELLCSRYGLDPATCVFIDDNANNCEGARVAGMHAIHFTGDVAALEQAIRELG